MCAPLQSQQGLEAYKLFLHLRLDAAATVHLYSEASAEAAEEASKSSAAVSTCAAAACAAAIARAAPTPAEAATTVMKSLLGPSATFAQPKSGLRVIFGGKPGVVWISTKSAVALAYDDLSWGKVTRDEFAERAQEEPTFDAEMAVAYALHEQSNGGVLPVCVRGSNP
tara:strand:- start:562 stop:1065 length:504 start_codon:yes stop_codon:yes gene_type:complete